MYVAEIVAVVGSFFLVVFTLISAHVCYNALLLVLLKMNRKKKNLVSSCDILILQSILLDEDECNMMPL